MAAHRARWTGRRSSRECVNYLLCLSQNRDLYSGKRRVVDLFDKWIRSTVEWGLGDRWICRRELLLDDNRSLW